MKKLAEFLLLAQKELVQNVSFSFTDNGMIKCTLTARIHDRKYEADHTAAPVDLEMACVGALHEWEEGLKVNPPSDTPKVKSTPREDGKFYCGECGNVIPERMAKASPPNTCRDVKCIQKYWGKKAQLRRGFKA